MEKGEITHYKQFLLFPQCLQKAYFPGASKGVIVWEWVNSLPQNPVFSLARQRGLFKTLWEKEKMLVTSIFSFFPNCFLPFPKQISIFQSRLFCCLQVLSNWTSKKNCRFVKS